jgi:GNAT superfamily N-acetyltransferase
VQTFPIGRRVQVRAREPAVGFAFMVEVIEATSSEIDRLVDLEAALFLEDAGRYDPYSDSTWPAREGREDFEELIASPDGIVLAARSSGTIIGLLAGYAAMASPTRQPVKYAVLRTMYVDESARREGTAMKLTQRFLDWSARARLCRGARRPLRREWCRRCAVRAVRFRGTQRVSSAQTPERRIRRHPRCRARHRPMNLVPDLGRQHRMPPLFESTAI